MRIAVVGGYGNAGRAIAGLLARHVRSDIALLGRDVERARRVAAGLAADTGATVEGRAVDASDPAAFRRAIEGADLVIVASSTSAGTSVLAMAVLAAGADWLDINLSSPAKLSALRALEPRIEQAGRCFITDGGVHPGLPGALIRFAATKGTLRAAAVAARFEMEWKSVRFSADTRREFLLELLDYDPSVFRDGRWRRGTRYSRRFDLGPPFGRNTCVPMSMEEIRELPGAHPSLRDAGFFIAGFGPLVDWAIMPLAFALASVSRRLAGPAARLLSSGLERFGSGSRGVAIVLEAAYEDGSLFRLRASHPDPYFITAAPAVAAVLQLADGRRPAGLHTQAAFLEPVRCMEDLARLGVRIDSA